MEAWTLQPLIRFQANRCIADYESYDADMQQRIREVGVRNMMLTRRMLDLLQRLHEQDVPAIITKGCHLIQSIYPFGIRPIEDIDILMDRKHFAVVDRIVTELGYRNRAFAMDVWTHVEISNKITYLNDTPPKLPIDVHFTLGPYPYMGRIPCDALFALSEPITVEGVTFRVLQSEMLLVHLCLHLLQHHDEHGQIAAYDMGAVTSLRADQIDWNRFVAIVRDYALQLPILHSIDRASAITDVRVPAWVMDQLRAIPASRKERRIFQASLRLKAGFERHVLQFMTLPSLKLKLLCLLKIAFPPKTFLRHYHQGSYVKYAAEVSRTAARALFRRGN